MFFGKCFEWKEIADCGIVSKKHGVRCGYESEYTVYFSCKKDMGGKAARYMLFDGVRVSVKKSEVESIACELRTYGREYAKLEPYISEYWE
ncbi:MAG: hypothetical protein IJB88_00405 [Clostridia bacterium]|nr:hypothetical protein [Clostridia bacterium]